MRIIEQRLLTACDGCVRIGQRTVVGGEGGCGNFHQAASTLNMTIMFAGGVGRREQAAGWNPPLLHCLPWKARTLRCSQVRRRSVGNLAKRCFTTVCVREAAGTAGIQRFMEL